MKTIRNYELVLHWKQGDDLAGIIEQTKTVNEAFMTWADVFEQRRDVCRQIARTLTGQNVEVIADTNYIAFSPKDDAAEGALEALVREELISSRTEEIDDEDR